MNTTEMVSVPRERALQLINLLAEVARTAHWLADNSEDCGDEGIDCQRVDFEAMSDALDKCEELPELPDSVYVRDGWLRAADELRALLAQSSEQYQGEPVGYQQRTMTDRPGSQWTPWRECCDATRARYSQEVGQFNQHGIMREIRPVFAFQADPGEVELLRAQLAGLETLHGGELGLPKEGWPAYHKRKMESLRDLTTGFYERKLAERDELLRESVKTPWLYDVRGKIMAYLSASAEPEVPQVESEKPGRCTSCDDCQGFNTGHDSSQQKPYSIRCDNCHKEARASDHAGLARAWNAINQGE